MCVRTACRGREDATRATAPSRERWWVFIPARTVVALVLAVALLNLHLALHNLHPIVAVASWVTSTVASVWALIPLWTACRQTTRSGSCMCPDTTRW